MNMLVTRRTAMIEIRQHGGSPKITMVCCAFLFDHWSVGSIDFGVHRETGRVRARRPSHQHNVIFHSLPVFDLLRNRCFYASLIA